MESRRSTKTYYGFLLVKKMNGTICGRFPVTKKECTLGRNSNCDIRILLENVSAIHCTILCINDKAYLRDKSIVGSTKVNGKKVGRNNYLLHHLDEIEICNRKFIWEYFNLQNNLSNNFSGKKSGTKNEWTTPRVRERSSNQLNIPLVPKDNNKISTPAKSSIKTSKTILSINKTPIVIASANMSKSSFDELKNSLKKPNPTPSEFEETTSCSMVSGQNIPLINIGGSTSIQRKSWIVTNTSDDNSSPRGPDVLNKLSSERLKRDSTPEFNSSYHYEDEDIEFDSPELPCVISSDKHSVVTNTTALETSESANNQNDDLHFQNSLANSEIEPSFSRRDTYSIDNRSLVFEQNTTSTPKRSILKSSKTAKPHRARSSCRMVQFARLPKTDSKIKLKSRFKSKSNYIVTDDEIGETDRTPDYRKANQSDDEEYDDDLDGVQPLDISVSSLINSPILEHININRSSVRGSRGNKVMSLVNSLEKCIQKSPKHSLRASDLLSMNSSKSTLNNDSLSNTNMMQESTSSRRINLEDVFVAEDSLKQTSCNIENKTISKDIDERSALKAEISSNHEIDLLNETETETVPIDAQNDDLSQNNIKTSCDIENKTISKDFDESSAQKAEISSNHELDLLNETETVSIDAQNDDLSENECEYTFASPLNLNSEPTSDTITGSDPNFVLIKKDSNINNIIDIQRKTMFSTHNVSHNIEVVNSKSFPLKNSTITDNNEVENNLLAHELSNISNLDNINIQRNLNQTINEEICIDEIRTPINDSELTVKNDHNIQNDDSEHIEKSIVGEEEMGIEETGISDYVEKSTIEDAFDKQNNDSEVVEKSSDEEDQVIDIDKTDISNHVEKSTIENDLYKQNNYSDTVEKSTNVEREIIDIEQTDVSNHVEKSTIEDDLNQQHNDSKVIEKSTNIEGEVLDIMQTDVSNLVEESTIDDDLDQLNNDSEIGEKSTIVGEEIIDFELTDVSNNVEKSTVEDVQNNVSEIIEKSIDVEKEQLDNVSKHIEQMNEEGPSMVVQCVSDMFNASVDEHEPTSCQNEDNMVESYVLVDTVLQKSTEEKKGKKLSNTLSKEYQSVLKNVEKQLIEIHEQTPSSRFNENEKNLVSTSNISKDKSIAPSSDLEETENHNLNTNDNLLKQSMHMSSIIESKPNKNNSELKTKSCVEEDNNTDTNCLSNIENSELLINTKDNETVDKSTGYNDELTLLLESLPVYDKTEKSIIENNSSNYVEKKTSNTPNSEEFNKSVQCTKDVSSTIVEHTNKTTCTSNEVIEIVTSSDNDDIEGNENQKKLNKNLEQTSDSSFGKPQYESTPWSSSKNTKTHFICTTSTQVNNETAYDKMTVNDGCTEEERHSLTPIPPDDWSQMMIEFNESVKKASISQTNITNASSVSKVLFNEPKSCQSIIKEPISNDLKNVVDTTQNSLKLTSCSSNGTVKTFNESDLTKRSIKNNSKRVLQKTTTQYSPKTKNKRLNYFKEKDDSDLTSFNETSKNNSIDIKTTINKTKSTALTTKFETKTMDNSTSNDITKFKKSARRQVKKPLFMLKANNNIQDLSSCDDNNYDTDSSSTGTLRISTRTKKLGKKNKNSIDTETAISTREKSKSKIISNDATSDIKQLNKPSKRFIKKTMPKSNQCYPKRNTKKSHETTKEIDLVDLTSNIDSNTDSNSSESLYLSTRTKKITKKSFSPDLSSRRHLRARGNKNNSSKSIIKSASKKTITHDKGSPINKAKGSLKSENTLQLSGKTLRKKENNLNVKELKSTVMDINQHTPIKAKKIISTTETKNKIVKITNKSTQPIETRITRQKSILIDTSSLESDKTSNINKNKITKKISQTKKSKISKSNKKSQLKRLLPSKPIKKNSTDSSEYESMSETEEVSKEPELVNDSLKSNKQKTKNKKVQNDNISTSLPTKHNKKEIINEPFSQRLTRTRKRTADTSISQPNAKGPKLNVLSTVASLPISHVSPPNHSSTEVKRTRNMTKKIAVQVSNNSLPETTNGNKKEKPILSEKTRGKKREFESEDSSNSSTKSRKVTRNSTKNSTTVKFNKNVKKSITPKLKKTRNTKEVIIEESLPAPRVLRNRGKKN